MMAPMDDGMVRFTKTRGVSVLQCLLFSLLLPTVGCGKLYTSNCGETDRDCGGGGILRSGKTCVRTGDCAEGLECEDSVCTYTASTARGEPCVVTEECQSGLYCSVIDLTCQPLVESTTQTCESSADCQRTQVCDLDGAQVFSEGPYEWTLKAVSDECRAQIEASDTPESCKLPRTCTDRNDKHIDLGGFCTANADCLPGLFCIPDPLDVDKSICYGGVELPVEPVSFPLWGGVKCPADTRTPTAYFEVPRASNDPASDFYRLPFPNELRRTDTGIDLSAHPLPPDRLAPQTAQRFISESGNVPGFATNPVVYFRFSREVRTSDLNSTTQRIVNITKDTPEYARLADLALEQPVEHRGNYICPHWLPVHPRLGSPLRSGTTYAALITRDVHASDDREFTRSPDLDALLSSSRPSDSALADAWETYAPLRAYLDDRGDADGISADDVLNATVFKTQDATQMIPRLRSAAEIAAEGSKSLVLTDVVECGPDVESPCDEFTPIACADHDAKSAFRELRGKIALPVFQRGTAPYATPNVGGDIPFSGELVAREFASVCFSLSLPKNPAPSAGYPLLLVAHGTGLSFADQMNRAGLAEYAASLPIPSAVLAIEMPMHGSRLNGTEHLPQDLFFNLMNPKAARGNVLQGAADLMSLTLLAARGIAANAWSIREAVTFDRERVVLYGQDQGATHAALMLGSEPRVRAAVLSALGGHVSSRLFNQSKPVDMNSVLPFLLFDPDLTSGKLSGEAANPALALLQNYMESADPVNYARELRLEPSDAVPTGHDVFMTFGIDDGFLADENQAAYALAAGLQAVDPDLADRFDTVTAPVQGNVDFGETQRTVVLRTYDPHSGSPDDRLPQDGHFVDVATIAGVRDVRGFLAEALQGQTPTIRSE